MNKNIVFILKIIFSISILAYLLYIIPINDIISSVFSANLILYLIGILLIVPISYFSAHETHYLTSVQKIRLSVLEILKIHLSTNFYSLFLPGLLSGGAVKWYKYTKHADKSSAAAVIVFNRFLEILMIFFTGIIFSLPVIYSMGNTNLLYLLIVIFISVLLFYFFMMQKSGIYFIQKLIMIIPLPKYVKEIFRKFIKAMQRFQNLRLKEHFKIFGLLFLYHVISIVSFLCLAKSLNIELSIWVIGWIRSAISMASLLPLSFAGIGIREGSLVFILGQYGIKPELSIALSLLFFSRNFLMSFAGGLSELKDTITSKKLKHADTNLKKISINSISKKGAIMNRILMLCYEYPPIGGGGAKVVHGLTNELSRKYFEIDLITMRYKGLPAFEKIDNLNIYRVNCIRLKKNICTFLEMAMYIVMAFPFALKLSKKNNYLINHTHFIFPDGIIAYLLYKFIGLNYIITAHGSDVPGYNPNRFKILHILLKPLWNMIVTSTKKIIFPSDSLRKVFSAVNNKVEGVIIPNGINIEKFLPSKEKKKEILVVSRMFERKGVQYILKAFQGLTINYTLNIVGDGPYLGSLIKLANDLNLKANFLGYVDNNSVMLRRLFEESEIFIFVSESENFPVVLLEAMLAGTAIITTRDTGCAEVVGDSAILVEPKNSNSIRESIIKLINNPVQIKNLQLGARRRVENNFSWKRVAGQYLELYYNYESGPAIKTHSLRKYQFNN